jgi:hypothetical protein
MPNESKSIPERVIDELLERNEIYPEDIAVAPLELYRRYDTAEAVGIEHVSLNDIASENIPSDFPMPRTDVSEDASPFKMSLDGIDAVISLSGRSGFYGQYMETKDNGRCQGSCRI